MLMPRGQLFSASALAIAVLIGAGALVAPMPDPPASLPQATPIPAPPGERPRGIGAECSRVWSDLIPLADAVRDPIVESAGPAEPVDPRPIPTVALNWRYVGTALVTLPDGSSIFVANVRVDGRQEWLTVGSVVPAAGSGGVELLEITPDFIRIRRNDAEETIELDRDAEMSEMRGFGS